jgi:hypothetical protein
MMKNISRMCIVCGKKLKIILGDNNKIISGGQYFGVMEIPSKGSKRINVGKSKIFGHDVEVVKHTKTRKVEYWECEQCVGGDSTR